jgi:uncharacterized lipoprotein
MRLKVSRKKYAFLTSLCFVLLNLAACATNTSGKYRDTSELERPPQLEVSTEKTAQPSEDSKPDSVATETKADSTVKTSTGLGDAVSLADESHLILNRPFDEAWTLVDKALKRSGMEISDRNREKGQYYVVFDPDTTELKNGEEPGLLTTFLTDNNYPKGRYLLTFYENPRSVKINVEFLEYPASENESEATLSDKGVAKLLKKLYTTLHDDLSSD